MKLRKQTKTALIGEVPLFAGLSKRELERVALLADEIGIRAGETLIAEGARGREFFVLVDGSVGVTRGGRTLRKPSGGSFFGEIALVSDVPRTATVTALTDLRVLVITDRAFRALMREVPSIALKVMATLGERLAAEQKSI
jgi:CRP-like cAMP-binding protein